MGLRDLLRGRRKPAEWGWDDDDPFAAEHALVERFLEAAPDGDAYTDEVLDTAIAQTILDAERPAQARTAVAVVQRLAAARSRNARELHTVRPDGRIEYPLLREGHLLDGLADALLRRKLPLDDAMLAVMVAALAEAVRGRVAAWQFPLPRVLGACERLEGGPSPPLERALGRLAEGIELAREPYAEEKQALRRIRALLSEEEDRLRLDPSEPWARAVTQAATGEAWQALLEHAATAKQSSPSKRWSAEAGERLGAVGRDAFRGAVDDWFPRVAERPEEQLVEPNATVLRGLIWICALLEDESVAPLLGDLAAVCFRKIPDVGARSVKAGNACLTALAMLGAAGAAQLGRMRAKAKLPSVRERVGVAMVDAAERAGVTPDELAETSVPGFGLGPDGVAVRAVGEFEARLGVTGDDRVELTWHDPKGKARRGVPQAVKRDHADALAELKAARKDLRGLLPAQRDRLERMLRRPRPRPLAQWREHYAQHPLVGTLARRLIWRAEHDGRSQLVVPREDGLVDRLGAAVELPDDAQVSLWHPLGEEVDTVQAWRLWLEEQLIRQPFKQAHREIYLVTDAERSTRTYSNRFAGHVVRQHQLASLLHARGWTYTLQGAWDSFNTPQLELPEWDLRVEFWLIVLAEDATQTGVFTHIGTDQVRFTTPDGEPVPIGDVPPLAFSEAIRDVDLFVGVCSVGNDPEWADSADRPAALREYWDHYAFGELSAPARTRRDVLERLLPGLKIAAQCRLEERYLVVEGELNTYWIHLGSGNVRMEPGSRYLCIVRDGSASRPAAGSYLPFEDLMLSLILSKALLLADDRRIEDPVITSQLGGG